MIPENVYNQVRYGTGAAFGAYMVRGDVGYGLSCIDLLYASSRGVIGTVYPTGELAYPIVLSDIPDSIESDWQITVSHEC